ncbi:hypothetical protein DES53_11553 [Roseimicrobium gellanilyticum]|uniref:Uncharacterized protein n=1 Tax=Roseimicrobium gellanilyticum TaxID=748857 RepID=A0A366H5J0_9BACT|nr:hypothetical protein DES53_11553 [Roseimicrobium gellanilyticum]
MRELPCRKEAAPVAESLHSGCYAVSAREVAAVRLGVGRGARHEIILRSGVRLPVPYAQATLLADKIWDGVWPDGATRCPRKKTRITTRSRARARAPSQAASGPIRQAIIHTLTREAQTPSSRQTRPHHEC